LTGSEIFDRWSVLHYDPERNFVDVRDAAAVVHGERMGVLKTWRVRDVTRGLSDRTWGASPSSKTASSNCTGVNPGLPFILFLFRIKPSFLYTS
jgi:hypothetical protein